MDWQIINKSAEAGAPPANLADYQRARRDFSWDQARSELAGLPGGRGINIAHEAVDRHVRAGAARTSRCAGLPGKAMRSISATRIWAP